VLRKSFGLPPSELFDWIEEVPIACGSIGQVSPRGWGEGGGCSGRGGVAVDAAGPGGGVRGGVLWVGAPSSHC
jgi:hypothetical protein